MASRPQWVKDLAVWYIHIYFFHTEVWFPASDHDFRKSERDFWCFCEFAKGKDIAEKIAPIMGNRGERNSLSWVCIPQKSLAITRDFWNTNSLGWTPFHMGAHDGFSISYMAPVCSACTRHPCPLWSTALRSPPCCSNRCSIWGCSERQAIRTGVSLCWLRAFGSAPYFMRTSLTS